MLHAKVTISKETWQTFCFAFLLPNPVAIISTFSFSSPPPHPTPAPCRQPDCIPAKIALGQRKFCRLWWNSEHHQLLVGSHSVPDTGSTVLGTCRKDMINCQLLCNFLDLQFHTECWAGSHLQGLQSQAACYDNQSSHLLRTYAPRHFIHLQPCG